MSLSNERHPANVIYNKIHLRYPVKVYPVNPNGGIFKRDRVYRAVEEIPGPVDLAVIAVRADLVPETLAQCIRSEVGGAVIISGGFAESGRADLQDRITGDGPRGGFPLHRAQLPRHLRRRGKFDTFFLPGERLVRPNPGNVGFVSQSGGVLVDQMVKFTEQGLGLSLAVSIGNKALIREIDLLRHLAEDPDTRVIAFYVEGFGRNEGRAFVELAAAIPKPVVVLKAGKTAEGSRAVSSHTASLAGDYQVFSDVLAQHGIVEARNEFELTCFCESLSHYPRGIDGNVGVITVSGGHGALASRHLRRPGPAGAAASGCRQGGDPGRPLRQHPRHRLPGKPGRPHGQRRRRGFRGGRSARSAGPPRWTAVLLLLLPYSPGSAPISAPG
ncbi:MAG: CoA-binding protein [Desulfobacterales bacterium]|nr:CoA-binding protein [Desulfobacterales bacterium]